MNTQEIYDRTRQEYDATIDAQNATSERIKQLQEHLQTLTLRQIYLKGAIDALEQIGVIKHGDT